VTIRNVEVDHFAGDAVSAGNGWRVEESGFAYDDIGVRIATGGVVQHNDFHDNASYGLFGYATSNVLVQDNEISRSNPSGTSALSGGAKFVKSTDVTFLSNFVHDNAGNGLHCDTDCLRITWDSNEVIGNSGVGILYEKSFQGSIRGNWVEANDASIAGQSLFFGSQIHLNASQGTEINANTVAASVRGTNGVGLNDAARGSGRYGTYAVANDYVHDNNVVMHAGGLTGLVGTAHNPTAANNRFVNNSYVLDSTSGAYFAWVAFPLTWSAWNNLGQDT
jgi:parallel beta helix pectate lyase-like protein